MDKLNMHTPNLADENFRKLAALFPNAVTETVNENGEVVRAIDKDVLMQEISTTVVEGREERYQFTWPDKKKAMLAANAPISATLRPIKADSVGKDGTPGGWDSENLYIEGDNFEVLKLLQETYLGKIKVIYIDPPYNTGSNLIYKNDFHQSLDDYLATSGDFDEEGNLLVRNLQTNGRFHTDWLNMIYMRLKLAKNLLSEDGVLVLTIDDYEIYTVTAVLNEVFGEENRLGTVIIKNNPQGRSSVTGFQISHEYALFYGKTESTVGRLPRSNDQLARYGETDENGAFEWRNFRAQYSTESPTMVYPIFVKKDCSGFRIPSMTWNPKSKKYDLNENPTTDETITLPIDETGRMRTWKWSIETVNKVKDEEMAARFDRAGKPTVYYKGRMKGLGMLPYTIWDKPDYSSSTFGANILADMLGKGVFSYPKSLFAVIDCLKVANADEEAIILDFFSGSATTAHAVMKLNAEDNGHRKFIMVQLPEKTEEGSSEMNAGYKNICEIGKERIRRAAKKIREDAGLALSKDFDGGFRCLRLDSSNMQDVYYTPGAMRQDLLSFTTDNIKPDRTPEDLLFQVLLELGVLPSSTIAETEIGGKRVFDVADGFLLACFDKGVTTETVTAIAKKQPYYAVFRDASMADDSTATNFDQIFETYSPSTVRKVL